MGAQSHDKFVPDEAKMKKHPNQIKYENKKMPKCFTPCHPFYDICNKMENNEKCEKCFKKHNLTDSIE